MKKLIDIDKSLKEKLEKLARESNRSLKNYIEYVLQKHIDDIIDK